MSPILSAALQTADEVKRAAAKTRQNLAVFGIGARKLANVGGAKETLFRLRRRILKVW